MSISVTFNSEYADDIIQQMSLFLGVNQARTTTLPTAPPEPHVEEPAKAARGRPRGSKKNSETTQPAVVENTGSAPAAVSPAAEDAQDGAGGETSAPTETAAAAATTQVEPSAAVSISFDEFRTKVQKAAEVQDGIKKVGEVLAKHGAKKVRDPKPEQYPAIVADLDALIAEVA